MRILNVKFINWPGIKHARPIALGDQPIQVVVGSNGSGKSSLGRAVKALFWPKDGVGPHCDLEAEVLRDGVAVRVLMRSRGTTWQTVEDSSPQDRPVGGEPSCHLLGVGDLLKVAGADDQALVETIATEMYGGANPAALLDQYKPKPGSKI